MNQRRKSRRGTWSRLVGRSMRRPAATRNPELMNVDFKQRVPSLNWQRLATPLIVVGLAAGLILTTLRTDIVRMEYDLAATGAEEQALLDQQRRLIAEHRNLLDPGRLRQIARDRGFVRPARVIEIEDESTVEVAVRANRP